MKKIFVLGSLIFLSFLFLLDRKLGTFDRPGEAQRSGNLGILLFDERPIIQTITPLHDNLGKIHLYTKTGFYKEKKNPNEEFIRFSLLEDGKKHVSFEFPTWNVPDNGAFSVTFPAVPDSRNKQFQIRMEAPTTPREDAIEILTSMDNQYDRGSLTVGTLPTEGDLEFTLFYRAGVLGTLIGLFRDFLHILLLDHVFSLMYLALVIGTGTLAVYAKRMR